MYDEEIRINSAVDRIYSRIWFVTHTDPVANNIEECLTNTFVSF